MRDLVTRKSQESWRWNKSDVFFLILHLRDHQKTTTPRTVHRAKDRVTERDLQPDGALRRFPRGSQPDPRGWRADLLLLLLKGKLLGLLYFRLQEPSRKEVHKNLGWERKGKCLPTHVQHLRHLRQREKHQHNDRDESSQKQRRFGFFVLRKKQEVHDLGRWEKNSTAFPGKQAALSSNLGGSLSGSTSYVLGRLLIIVGKVKRLQRFLFLHLTKCLFHYRLLIVFHTFSSST